MVGLERSRRKGDFTCYVEITLGKVYHIASEGNWTGEEKTSFCIRNNPMKTGI